MLPFDVLVRRHGPTVLRVSRAMVGASDADDVWSETFLAALRAYPELPADANHEAWLVTIAHRKAIDVHRRARRRAVPNEDVAAVIDRTAAAAAPGLAAELDHDPDVHRAMAALSERQRACVVYHHIAGLPYREVAAVVGGSEAAVRRAAADGISRLRAALADRPGVPTRRRDQEPS